MGFIDVLLALSAVLAAGGVGWFTVRLTRKKLAAEAKKLAAETDKMSTLTALSLINPLKERIDDLEEDMVEVHEELNMVREENRLLRIWGKLNYSKVKDLGGDPAEFEDVVGEIPG